MPAPSGREGWQIKWLLILYNIQGMQGSGKIDKVELRDGNRLVHAFENLNLGPNNDWAIKYFHLPPLSYYDFGLGVSIHVEYGQSGGLPTQFLFSSLGLAFFGKPSDASFRSIPAEGLVNETQM